MPFRLPLSPSLRLSFFLLSLVCSSLLALVAAPVTHAASAKLIEKIAAPTAPAAVHRCYPAPYVVVRDFTQRQRRSACSGTAVWGSRTGRWVAVDWCARAGCKGLQLAQVQGVKLHRALRKALGAFYPQLDAVHLVDYKVRILDGASATGAKTRVVIDSVADGETWSTMGVGENIISAELFGDLQRAMQER